MKNFSMAVSEKRKGIFLLQTAMLDISKEKQPNGPSGKDRSFAGHFSVCFKLWLCFVWKDVGEEESAAMFGCLGPVKASSWP